MKRQLPKVLLSSFRTTKRRQKPAYMEFSNQSYEKMEKMDCENDRDEMISIQPVYYQHYFCWEPSPAYHQFSDHPHGQFNLEQQQPQKERNTSSPSIFDQALIRANSAESPCTCNPSTIEKRGENLAKVHFVLDELMSTECNYVKELGEILFNYVQPFEALELAGSSNQIPSALRGQADILFGNIRDLYEFHHSLLLPAFEQNSDSVEGISAVLSNPTQRQRLLALYRNFCRNKQVSESLRSEHGVDQNKFFMECQRRAGHLLPLSAYLLKPVQRITKYQLLLKELVRHCTDAQLLPVQTALSSMLDLLAQINADMEQLHILGYPGDLRLLGPLRLQTECEVFVYKRAKSSSLGSNGGGAGQTGTNGGGTRRGTKGKHQKRHLFLFDGGVLFCKKRVQSVQFVSEYYEHKFCIHIASLGFAECSRHSEDRFELWDQSDCCSYAIQPIDERARPKWIQKLARLTVLHHHHHQQQQRVAAEAAAQTIFDTNKMGQQSPALIVKTARPQSWTTTSSSEDGNIASCSTSIHSSRSSTSSATTFEEKCQQPTTIIGGHIIQSATEPTFQQNDEEDKNELLNGQQQRSKSQPPEISMAIERQKKENGKKLVDRL